MHKYLFVFTGQPRFTEMAEIPILTYSFETPAVLANQKLPEHVRVLVAKLRHRPFQNTAFYRAALVALSPTAPVARSTSRGTGSSESAVFLPVNIGYTTMPNYD